MPESVRDTVLLAHPSPDLYGSDLQMLETVTGFVDDDWRVVVVLPKEGPLLPLLVERGAEVRIMRFPVVSRSLLHPRRFLGFVADTVRAQIGAHREIRRVRPSVVWVNTVTCPVWLSAARSAGTRAVVHVHEAEEDGSKLVRMALVSPLALARTIVVNSRAASRAITDALPFLRAKIDLVYNGVPGPEHEPVPPAPHQGTTRIALVGRLSPRKGSDTALEATALLRAEGLDVHLDLYGAVFPGYEWFETELRERAARPDLDGAVTFHGYVRPVWRSLEAADVVIVPSRVEPFGNVAVEAQMACRPVVVSAVQGLTEIVSDGDNGLHAQTASAADLARAVGSVIRSPELAHRLALAGRRNALDRFTVERYRSEIARVLDEANS
ncbi:MAG: glycosyltransferase family 4 protein [Propioniciclava sp.]|uniref:glycosyltransferase family 4 protein n=1 Tax=Propioniciclava sp. TaxID=2038686 RepID=UPI0039E299D8